MTRPISIALLVVDQTDGGDPKQIPKSFNRSGGKASIFHVNSLPE